MRSKATLKRNRPEKGEKWAYTSTIKYVLRGGGTGKALNEFVMYEDSALMIREPEGENIIYLYPEQVEQLRKLLDDEAQKQS